MLKRACLSLVIIALAGLSVTALTGSANAEREGRAAPEPGHRSVYKVIRPGISVSLTKVKGTGIVEAGVSAPGRCEDEGSEKPPIGFGLKVQAINAIPVDATGRFEHRGALKSVLIGRFAGNKVVGTFHQSYVRNVGEGPEGRCGNIVPKGRRTHYVAWLVEVDGKKVPHPPIRGRVLR